MKNLLRTIPILVLGLAFTAPLAHASTCDPNANGGAGNCSSGSLCIDLLNGVDPANPDYGCVTDPNATTNTSSSNGSSGLPSSSSGSSGLPTSGSGAGGINASYLQGYADSIINFINDYLVDVVIAIAFITFLWGVYKYFVLGAAKPEDRKEGAQFVLWGVIGFVIIVTLWGLVHVVSSTLNLSPGGSAPQLPKL